MYGMAVWRCVAAGHACCGSGACPASRRGGRLQPRGAVDCERVERWRGAGQGAQV